MSALPTGAVDRSDPADFLKSAKLCAFEIVRDRGPFSASASNRCTSSKKSAFWIRQRTARFLLRACTERRFRLERAKRSCCLRRPGCSGRCSDRVRASEKNFSAVSEVRASLEPMRLCPPAKRSAPAFEFAQAVAVRIVKRRRFGSLYANRLIRSAFCSRNREYKSGNALHRHGAGTEQTEQSVPFCSYLSFPAFQQEAARVCMACKTHRPGEQRQAAPSSLFWPVKRLHSTDV